MWPTTCMWCRDRDVFFFSGKTERWQKVLETSLLHRAWWLMSMKLIHLMKSQSYVFPFKCLKTNKQGWRWGKSAAFYMKLKRSNSVEWLKGEYMPEEVPPPSPQFSTVTRCCVWLRLLLEATRGSWQWPWTCQLQCSPSPLANLKEQSLPLSQGDSLDAGHVVIAPPVILAYSQGWGNSWPVFPIRCSFQHCSTHCLEPP